MASTSKIKLFVFDLDGTALGGHQPYDVFPPYFARFLDRLARAGIQWATNTTWSPEAQLKVISASGLKSRPVFLAGATGRALARVDGNKLCPDQAYARRIRALDRRFLGRCGSMMRALAARLIKTGLADELYYMPYAQPCLTVSFAGNGDASIGWRLLHPLLKSGLMYRMSGNCKADTLMPAYMNKGAPIRYMQARLGLGAGETMVAGDGWNDRPMFDPALAAWMVCPANAHPAIKEIVRRNGGVIGRRRFSAGVIEAVGRLADL